MAAFRKGLNEAGYVEGQNVAIEYRWAEGQYDRLPALAADLVRRQVAVIVDVAHTCGARGQGGDSDNSDRLRVGGDPVKLGLVASLNRPGGNVTGITFYQAQVGAKRLGLLHELVPKATVSPCSSTRRNAYRAELKTRMQAAARSSGCSSWS